MKIKEIKSTNLDHLGIISAIVFNLKIIEEIDKRIPVTDKSNVSMGQRVLAMILNGLGFTNERLYLVPLFFENKPLERLIGSGIEPGHLNDDCLGRALDAIAEYGTTKLFSEIAFAIAVAQGLVGKSAHLDTTSLSVFGDCLPVGTSLSDFKPKQTDPLAQAIQNAIENKGKSPAPPYITYGHSKDHRPDLKQVVLSMVTTGPAGIPIFMEALDGNNSDKTSFHNTIKKVNDFQRQIQDTPSFIWVADSALYTSDKLLLLNNKLTWITRVPAALADVKALTEMPAEVFEWKDIGNGCRMVSIYSNYGGIKQRWLLFFSQEAYEREILTFERRQLKTEEKIAKKLWHSGNEEFACKADACKALYVLSKGWKYHYLHDIKIEEVLKFEGKGRPKKGEQPVSVTYKIKASFAYNEAAITAARNSKGRFILAGNQLDVQELSDLEIFKEYKNQSQVERGFRFLKDPWFMVDSVFLKKPARIEALMMIMTLCLMVYNIGEHELREKLKVKKESIPNQVGKSVNNPTLRWIFQLMQGIVVIPVLNGGVNLFRAAVTNLTELRQRIIGYFGRYALEIYGIDNAVPDG